MKASIVAAIFASLTVPQALAADAGVEQSFARLFAHGAYSGPTATRIATGVVDPFAQQVNVALRTPMPTTPAARDYTRQADGSFRRMLDHTPYAGATEGRYALGEQDAAERAIHAALRNESGALRLARAASR